jgi:hypothetical protein
MFPEYKSDLHITERDKNPQPQKAKIVANTILLDSKRI